MSQRDRPANFPNPTAFIGMLVCLAPLGGCLEQTNDLLDIEPLPALSEGATPETSSLRTGDPSLASSSEDPWDRSDWKRVQIRIPTASVRHEPTYVDRPIAAGSPTTAGRKVPSDDFPTANTALIVETDPGVVIFSGVLAPFAAAWDLVESPIRMILTPPWSVQEGPDASWALLPEPATARTGDDS
ncbi:MAG: hypothetical protein CMJ23_09200 [Phycisphaerae bacterium]|nr:hypothetical protein [Phycisphaerae bacterium]